jgi:ribosomal protein S5
LLTILGRALVTIGNGRGAGGFGTGKATSLSVAVFAAYRYVFGIWAVNHVFDIRIVV